MISKPQKGLHTATLVAVFTLLLGWSVPTVASAQDQIKPRILVIFDTSGSMQYLVDNDDDTRGDGSWDPWDPTNTGTVRACCPGGGNSRMFAAKEAMRQMIFATGDIEFALMKFAQQYQTSDNPNNYYSQNFYYGNQVSGSADRLRYNDTPNCPTFSAYNPAEDGSASDWLCTEFPSVDLPDNRGPIMMWMDHHEFRADGSGIADSVPAGWSRADNKEQELRATTYTPLGASMYAAESYLEYAFVADYADNAAAAQCRPYSVILLTDGEETCGGDPASASVALHTLEDTPVDKAVSIWAIGFAFSGDMSTLDTVAENGGTDYARTATSQAELSGVLYDIVSSSILVEVCNQADDDCDGETDEDFRPDRTYCNTGASCTFPNDGQPEEDQDILCERPSECACDGIDNNCDGETDEPPDGENSWPSEANSCGGCDSDAIADGWDCTADPNEGRCDRGDLVCSPGAGMQCVGAVNPVAETCNGLDDDCDGETDEDTTGAECGACGDGNWVCVAAELQCCGVGSTATTCVPIKTPTVEDCNAQDDDCDGTTDEDILAPCGGCDEVGCGDPNEGMCSQGQRTCTAGVWGTCEGEIGPAGESCNGQDDDCDGETDEGIIGTGCGICGDGNWYCLEGGEQCCASVDIDGNCLDVQVPTIESCNAVDDDCDGATDEEIPPQACMDDNFKDYEGIGICHGGYETCVGGLWGGVNPSSGYWEEDFCLGEQLPSTEECNGVDDDCDGDTDEDIVGEDGCGPCGDGHEECISGMLQCTGASTPEPEKCDNLDNNCNGAIDENLTQTCMDCDAFEDTGLRTLCTNGTLYGICHGGMQTCKNGDWGYGETAETWEADVCGNQQLPEPESCDCLDNDCDNSTDEEIGSPVGEVCGNGCGVWECVSCELKCSGFGQAEACNGLDDNCNELTDEGIVKSCGGCRLPDMTEGGDTDTDMETEADGGDVEIPAEYADCLAAQEGDSEIGAGEGECQEGAILCDPNAADLWGECEGAVGPSTELCDALDNDCDGITDEEDQIEQVNEVCATAVGICEEGWWRCVDDTTGGKSLECCADVIAGECAAPEGPEEEVCDGLDNDCDGLTDEELPNSGQSCGDDLGACEAGTIQCVCKTVDDPSSCGMQCQGQSAGTDESCNGIDDDCDGETDEELPLGEACGIAEGECDSGFMECINGDYICNANGPGVEICDGLDNNCDGVTDENLEVECQGESQCKEGKCAPLCVGEEMQCPPGDTCVTVETEAGTSIRICVTDVCRKGSENALPCVDNPYWCDEGYVPLCRCSAAQKKCVSLCEGVVCPDGRACVPKTGQCQPITDECYAAGCTDGKVCKGGECVDDPCRTVSCDSGEYCNPDGNCVKPCVDIDCPVRCFEGECVDPCDGVTCETDEVCNDVTGECELEGACDGVGCKYYEVCRGGECVEDPCWSVTCPNGLVCTDGSCGQYGETKDTEDTGGEDSDGMDTDTTPDGHDTDSVGDTEGDTGPDNSYGMNRVLATGMGGCLCSATPGAQPSSSSIWMLFATAVGFGIRAMMRRRAYAKVMWMGIWLLGALLAFGCKTEPFIFSNGSDGNLESDHGNGTGDEDSNGDSDDNDSDDNGSDSTDVSDTNTEECVSTDPDDDCDGVDDNCDGETDEGVDVKTSSQFCGSCDNDCRYNFENAFGMCENGVCAMGDCAPAYQDVNKDTEDGCEYFCQKVAEEDRCNGVDLGDGSYKGVDDDCDGLTDEDSILSTDASNCGRCGNVCRAPHAKVTCVDGECGYDATSDCDDNFYDINKDKEDGCEYSCTKVSAEESACDNKDDNCDGETDEGNPEGGGTCGGSTNSTDPNKGICAAGSFVCRGGVQVCEGSIGPKPVESCNGEDDDCDGEVDENLARSCSSDGAPDVETGVCRKGYERCENGVWGACAGETLPSEEMCDNLDNDCDGETDEDLTDMGAPCGGSPNAVDPSEGACETGVSTCVGGNTVCEGAVGPVQETCNNADDDCDGKTDEGLTEVCGGCDPDVYDYCTGRTQGLCAPGYRTCSGGEFGDCIASIGPKTEVCDGFDNDCDGEIDEGDNGGVLTGNGCGTCGGIEHCLAGHMSCCLGLDTNGDCMEPGSATLETCNGIDDNCDGMTDNGIVQQLCDGPDVDSCKEGVFTCVGGIIGCSDETGDSLEVCDGMDNDCDGETDEELTTPPEGWCKESCGAAYLGATCVGASGWRCSYDCEGGVVQCNGNDQVVNSETLCDGLDNDCDGQTDENLTALTESCGACGNNCEDVAGSNVATMVCVAEECRVNECDDGFHNLDGDLDCEYGPCTETGSESTVCDDVDNDCNGLTDEGAATTEVCDGEDNDCDGQTDEGLSPPDICNSRCPAASSHVAECYGAEGWKCNYNCVSEGGTVDCDGNENTVAATETLCDGVDNNCDGTTDEGFMLWGDRAAFKGAQCTSDGIGGCSQKGYVKCAANQTEYICCTTQSGTTCTSDDIIPETPAPGVEDGSVPDGVDNDCDGMTDEGADGCVDTVSITGDTGNFEVFAYEASKRSSNQAAPCSEAQGAGEKPWTNVSFDEARNACLQLNDNDGSCSYDDPDGNSGCWDLCTAEQWYYTCSYGNPSASAPHLYPYGATYNSTACNGVDYDAVDGAIPAGAATSCVSSWNASDKVADMSGNVEEWTLDVRTVDTTDLRVIRGGSYKTVADGLTCNFDFFAADEFDLQMDQLGFRCCKGVNPISACQSAISRIPNMPADFNVTGLTDQCSSDGWWRASGDPSQATANTDWELGKTTKVSGNSTCLWATLLVGNYHSSYGNNLYSPPLDLSACAQKDVSIVWNMYLDVGNSGDVFSIERRISTDNGATWLSAFTALGSTYTTDQTDWSVNYTRSLTSDLAGSGPYLVQLRFRFTTDGNNNAAGAFIDNVRFVEN